MEILNKIDSLKIELISDMRPGGNGIEVRAKKLDLPFNSMIIFAVDIKLFEKKLH